MGNRPAFVFTMAIMFGMAILGIAAMLAIAMLFTAVIVPTIPDIITDVPTLYDYDEFGHKILSVEEYPINPDEVDNQVQSIQSQINELQEQMMTAIEEKDFDTYQQLELQVQELDKQLSNLDFQGYNQPNQILEKYWFFAFPSMFILVIFIIFASATYYWEKSFSIIPKGTSSSILKTSIIGIVVILIIPEFWDIFAINMKQFSLYLIDPIDGNPGLVTQKLWCKMGCAVNIDDLLDQNRWGEMLSSPNTWGEHFLVNAILPLFKAIPTMMLSLTLFVIAKVRFLFIAIILITLPVWIVCLNIPMLKKIAHDMIQNMMGASIAPIFSALTLSVGWIIILESDYEPLQEWIMVLAIGIFTSVWPIILAPKLSVIANQTAGIVQTAIQSSSMMLSGAAAGMSSGMAHSGAMGSGMSAGMKAKTLLSSGMMGGAMGGAGHITPMNVDGVGKAGVTNALNKGLGESAVSGNVAGINSTNPNLVDSQISNGHMNNPSAMMNGLQGMSAGQSHMNTPAYAQQVSAEVNKLGVPPTLQSSATAAIMKADGFNPSGAIRT